MRKPPACSLGHPRVHLRRVSSTNDLARRLASAGAPHGTLVTAAEQTQGRGRQGRSWSAPPGSSLLMSLVVRWAPATGHAPQLLPLAAAVAIADVAGEQAQIKWPNDVVVAQAQTLRKLAGILIESRAQEGWAVLGIGLNVAVELAALPDEVARGAATMGCARDQVEPTLGRLLGALERRLGEGAQDTLQAWRARDALLGRAIAWGQRAGTAEGIDGSGRLVVRLPGGGRTELQAGEVHLRLS